MHPEALTKRKGAKKPKTQVLRKRAIVETVNDQLKNISQIEHTRHRSAGNFLINLLAGIAAYTHQQKKPSIHLFKQDLMLVIAA